MPFSMALHFVSLLFMVTLNTGPPTREAHTTTSPHNVIFEIGSLAEPRAHPFT